MPNIKTAVFHKHIPCAVCQNDLYLTPPGQWTFAPRTKNFYHTRCMVAPAPATPNYNPPAPPIPPPKPSVNSAPKLSASELERLCKQLISNDEMIYAIRLYRENTGSRLYEAKQQIDRWRDELYTTPAATPVSPVVSTKAHALKPLVAPLDFDYSDMHNQTEHILRIMQAGLYPLLHGAPGAGKTHLAMQIAERAFNDSEKFCLISCSQDMSRIDLLGSKNPITGDYYASKFFSIFANGGVVLFDETGNAPGNFLNLLNGLMAQRMMLFPNGQTVTMHKNCYFLFADNTNLWGDDHKYPERMDAGGAFRNRLFYIHFKYDEALEARVCIKECPDQGAKWYSFVKAIRPLVEATDLGIAASPRFAYAGARILESIGYRLTPETAMQICDSAMFEGLRASVISELRSKVEREAMRLL